jgi:hypothetical protein
VGKSYHGSDLKGTKDGLVKRNSPFKGFPAAADLNSAPPYRASPLAVHVFLVACVKLHPLGCVCSTSRALFDLERALFPSVTSRLSAASFNTRAPPLIRPRTLLSKKLYLHRPRPLSGKYLGVFSREKKTYRTSRAGDLSARVQILLFQQPSVHGFPTILDQADRSCRHRVMQPCHAALYRASHGTATWLPTPTAWR